MSIRDGRQQAATIAASAHTTQAHGARGHVHAIGGRRRREAEHRTSALASNLRLKCEPRSQQQQQQQQAGKKQAGKNTPRKRKQAAAATTARKTSAAAARAARAGGDVPQFFAEGGGQISGAVEKSTTFKVAPPPQRPARRLAHPQAVLAFHSEVPKTISSSRNPSYCLRKPPLLNCTEALSVALRCAGRCWGSRTTSTGKREPAESALGCIWLSMPGADLYSWAGFHEARSR